VRAAALLIGLVLVACEGADAPAPASTPVPAPAVETPSAPRQATREADALADLDRRLLGKWRIEQWGVSYEIRLVDGTLVVTGQDYVNEQAFEVSDVRWEPPVLHATFRMPSTNHTTRSQLRVLDDDRLEDTYTGAAAGVDVWERVP
jgi:hypothetical protein